MSTMHVIVYSADQCIDQDSLPSAALSSFLAPRSFASHFLASSVDVLSLLLNVSPAVVLIKHEGGEDVARANVKEVISRLRYGGNSLGKRVFIILWSTRASRDARERSYWSRKQINMVTDSFSDICTVLSEIQTHLSLSPDETQCTCPHCNLSLTFEYLPIHVGLYHIQDPNPVACPKCDQVVPNLPKHFELAHLSITSSTASVGPKYRQPVFALVVCRRQSDGRFLMVDEVSSQGWWLPGGGVNIGEDLIAAAERETMEEAGVSVQIKGVLRVEYTPSNYGFRLRVIFYAEPLPLISQKSDNSSPTRQDRSFTPKTIPDSQSAAACWVSLEQFGQHLPLRGREPLMWFPYVAKGGKIWPLSILTQEKDEVMFIPNSESSIDAATEKVSSPTLRIVKTSNDEYERSEGESTVEFKFAEIDEGD
ncbi:hypothetical protein HK098_004652 [Nowakowskiella sp. JEL0407]|nr:hypothetical protein HK098_004652 [Nowakowskiella sp. JEL0407]